MLLPLLLALTIDGDAALRHASRLAALGPHPWGSALDRGAAQYVAAQLRAAGLTQVRLQEFSQGGTPGTNVIARRPGRGDEVIVIGAHHDSAPTAPGAYDDGGGVGILIELARLTARETGQPRTLVFVSFDGEEGWSRGMPLAGSRAFVDKLGADARHVVAMIAIEMSGFKTGTPTLHPIAYADPLRPGEYVITPEWLARAALSGARKSLPATALGDPYLSWIYQPAVRSAQIRLYGDDASFLERGIPAIMASDSSFSSFYPEYHSPADTADKLDAAALTRMGNAVGGIVQALETATPGPMEGEWIAAFGVVLGRMVLLMTAFFSIWPRLILARETNLARLFLAGVQTLAFGAVAWRSPVVAVACFGVANLLGPFLTRWWLRLLTLVPFLATAGLVYAAWRRGIVAGSWLPPWLLGAAVVAGVLAMVPLRSRAAKKKPARAAKAPAGGARRGLPKTANRRT